MKNTYLLAFALTAAVAAAMTSCGTTAVTDSLPASETSTSASVSTSASTKSGKTTSASEETTTAATSETASVEQLSGTSDSTYTKRDLAQVADTSDAKSVTVSDGKTINITEEGVYVISGTAEDCTIRVEADEQAKVQLVLDGVEITNSDFPAIYVVSADKVFVTTTDSDNTLTVSGQFTSDGDTNTDAVIFSKDDLVLNGVGTLNVTSNYGNGITCKDDMKVTGGTYNVTCALDAFEANDSISVSDGTFNITTNKDGFHCENDEAEGTIVISGGTFTINGGSDGLQACAMLQIDGGTFKINAAEGLEATYIVINDGDIDIYATDDGINASASTNAYETAIVINGGYVKVEVGPGDTDGLDANGSIYVNGGTVDVTAQMSSFDYDRTAEFNGGTIIVNGTEVDSIPQSMMGGGGFGGGGGRGGHGGGFGGFGGGQMF
ncbi:MAG: carbohydrate-binding domain-containing protein [Ruminococcus sp.]|nr:carbohydrate-binding domain-containing protein [Ruminococcus sp.]